MVLVGRPHCVCSEVAFVGCAICPGAGVVDRACVGCANGVAEGVQFNQADVDAGGGVCQFGDGGF